MDSSRPIHLDGPEDECEDSEPTLSVEEEGSGSANPDPRPVREDWAAKFIQEVLLGTVPRTLEFQIPMLKRRYDTMQLHQLFSTSSAENESQVLDRISKAWKAARQVAAYTCISEYIFAEPRIDRHFCYPHVVSEVRSRTQPLKLVDVGCCVGTDVRRLIQDGFPPGDITGLDVENRFFPIGFALYNQNPRDCGTTFVQANVVDPDFTQKFAHLEGKFDYVHSSNVIHLFDYSEQIAFMRALAFLAKPGGLIWGRQVGEAEDSPTRSLRVEGKGERFTPSEFMRMWTKVEGFERGKIEWMSRLVSYDELRLAQDCNKDSLEWSIKALV